MRAYVARVSLRCFYRHILFTFRTDFSAIVPPTEAEMFPRSTTATIGATTYWLAFVCASVYPEFDNRPSAGFPAFVLAWPWVVFQPSTAPSLLVPGCALLNTALIYVFIGTVSFLWGRFRQKGEP